MSVKHSPSQVEPVLLDLESTARLLSISKAAAHSLIEQGALSVVQLPACTGKGKMRRILCRKSDVLAFIDKHSVSACQVRSSDMRQVK